MIYWLVFLCIVVVLLFMTVIVWTRRTATSQGAYIYSQPSPSRPPFQDREKEPDSPVPYVPLPLPEGGDGDARWPRPPFLLKGPEESESDDGRPGPVKVTILGTSGFYNVFGVLKTTNSDGTSTIQIEDLETRKRKSVITRSWRRWNDWTVGTELEYFKSASISDFESETWTPATILDVTTTPEHIASIIFRGVLEPIPSLYSIQYRADNGSLFVMNEVSPYDLRERV